jgi:hypothetical protein
VDEPGSDGKARLQEEKRRSRKAALFMVGRMFGGGKIYT